MAARLIVLTLCVAAVVGGGIPAAKYPAGVDHFACPNYPYCDNVALAAHSAGHHSAAAHYAAPTYAAYGHHGVAVHGAAAKYPAGVNPHVCPNYPYCDNVALAAHSAGHHGAVAHYAAPTYTTYRHHGVAVHGAAAKYPAGVNPHVCPNYPYCDVALAAHGAHGAHGWAGANRGHGLVAAHRLVAAQGLAGHGWAGAYAAPAWGHGAVAGHHGAGAHYPAGVDPHTCPNYPYCH